MKENLNKILDWFRGSFETGAKGASARKMTAFAMIIMVIILHIKWFRSDRWEYIGEVLGLDLFFILCLLGLATWQALKTAQKQHPPDHPQEQPPA